VIKNGSVPHFLVLGLQGLVDPSSQGQIVLDPQLCDALFEGESHGNNPLPTHMNRAEVSKRFTRRLGAYFRMKGGKLKKPSTFPARMVPGKDGKEPRPPGVSIKTETRRGHNVTLVRNLELLGIDPEVLMTACVVYGLLLSCTYAVNLCRSSHKK